MNFDVEIQRLQRLKEEAERLQSRINDLHFCKLLEQEIVEFVHVSLPTFDRCDAVEDLKLKILEVFSSFISKKEADLDDNHELPCIPLTARFGNGEAEHSFSDLTRNEVAHLESSPKLEQLLTNVRAIRIRFAKMFGFKEFECTPTFIKEFIQDIILSIPTLNLNVKSLEQVGVNQFWHTVDVCLNAYERYVVEQEQLEGANNND
ncbi:MAG TPA: hypothetical protein DCY88_07910 [Cyanobacteria bacterium UBA11372]|nr:hypothetical protein [Cyanobacteria bacterium UBA11372]